MHEKEYKVKGDALQYHSKSLSGDKKALQTVRDRVISGLMVLVIYLPANKGFDPQN